MKSGHVIWILLASLVGGPAQVIERTVQVTNDPICGFLAKHAYLEAAAVRQGVAVDLFVGDTPAGRPVTLRFFVNEKPRGFPIDDLQVEHEKLVHVIGVRDDLRGFFHLHPTKSGSGLWAVTHVFTNTGRYKIWSDVKYRGTSYSFAHPMLTVSNVADSRSEPDPKRHEVKSGYTVTFHRAEPLPAGRINRLEFMIRDAAGGPVETENFLGAAMHLVIVKDDLSVFLHAHPDNHGSVATNVYFSQVFPRPGRYKLFLQYRPGTAGLPPDDAFLAEFQIAVTD